MLSSPRDQKGYTGKQVASMALLAASHSSDSRGSCASPSWAEPAPTGALACPASPSEVGLLTWPPFLGTPVAAAWEQCVLGPQPAQPSRLEVGRKPQAYLDRNLGSVASEGTPAP